MSGSSSSLSAADPRLAELALLLEEEFARVHAPRFLVRTSVYRPLAVQEALWLQGRANAKAVNDARALAGLPSISEAESARQVTWTRASKHTVFPSRAIDYAVATDPDGPVGPLKPVIDWRDTTGYCQLGQIAEGLGLVWGGRWRRADLCHVELKEP